MGKNLERMISKIKSIIGSGLLLGGCAPYTLCFSDLLATVINYKISHPLVCIPLRPKDFSCHTKQSLSGSSSFPSIVHQGMYLGKC